MRPSHFFNRTRSEPDWTLLGRFFRGDCSVEELESIARWEAASPSHAALVAFMRRVWEKAAIHTADVDADVDEDEGWRAVRQRIATATAAEPSLAQSLHLMPKAGTRRRRALRGWLAAAATVVVIGGLLVWRMTARVPASRIGVREYVTGMGQRTKLMLVDSTRIWLNVDSRLRVPADYGTTARDVELDGEAYFIVKHDAKRPFRVHSRGTVSEDFGTEFSVRAYPGDRVVQVVVVEGKVGLGRGTTVETVLGGDDLGTLGLDDTLVVQHRVDVSNYLAWVDRQSAFGDVPVGMPMKEIPRNSRPNDLAREDSMKLLNRSLVALGLAAPVPALGQAIKPADLVGTWVAPSNGGWYVESYDALFYTFDANGTYIRKTMRGLVDDHRKMVGDTFYRNGIPTNVTTGRPVRIYPQQKDSIQLGPFPWKLVGDTLDNTGSLKRVLLQNQRLFLWDLDTWNANRRDEKCALVLERFDSTKALPLSLPPITLRPEDLIGTWTGSFEAEQEKKYVLTFNADTTFMMVLPVVTTKPGSDTVTGRWTLRAGDWLGVPSLVDRAAARAFEVLNTLGRIVLKDGQLIPCKTGRPIYRRTAP